MQRISKKRTPSPKSVAASEHKESFNRYFPDCSFPAFLRRSSSEHTAAMVKSPNIPKISAPLPRYLGKIRTESSINAEPNKKNSSVCFSQFMELSRLVLIMVMLMGMSINAL